MENNTTDTGEVFDENLAKKAEEIERAEQEKKFESQKLEIRKKLNEAEDALNVKIKEAEEDFEQVLVNEPNLLTPEDIEGYKAHIEEKKQQIKSDIVMLHRHEQELELDYEDLKTDPKEDMLNDYSKDIDHAAKINAPLMKMVFDYFNFLNDNVSNQEKAKIKIDCFLSDKGLFTDSFPHATNMDYYNGSVMINFKDTVRVIVTLKKYFEQQQFNYRICFVSEGKTDLNPDYITKKILFNAISHSKVKGTYITLPPDSIMWSQEKLERRGFADIFLPKSIMQDLTLYTTLYQKTGKLLRYLMIGNPGTGKTESTLAIANFLKDKKVTIIKTMVCDSLKEKIELAELLAPSLIIFDDIDLSLGSRKKGGVSHGLAQFLDVLDGTEKIRKDVGFIATTNSLELLDMAAQRPGRFDKLLSFDSLTKTNIKNIIFKSLKRNFEVEADSAEAKPFIHESVIETFHNAKVTGAHIYNTIKMLKLRIHTLELEATAPTTPEWIVNEIKSELETLNRIRRTDYLQDKMSGSAGSNMGFPMSGMMRNDADEDDMDDSEYNMKESEAPKKSFETYDQSYEKSVTEHYPSARGESESESAG